MKKQYPSLWHLTVLIESFVNFKKITDYYLENEHNVQLVSKHLSCLGCVFSMERLKEIPETRERILKIRKIYNAFSSLEDKALKEKISFEKKESYRIKMHNLLDVLLQESLLFWKDEMIRFDYYNKYSKFQNMNLDEYIKFVIGFEPNDPSEVIPLFKEVYILSQKL